MFHLERFPNPVDATDAAALRGHLMSKIREEIMLKGEPHPKILLAGDGYIDTLNLDAMSKGDRGASAGATFQALGGPACTASTC